MGKAATIGVFDGVHSGHRYLLEQLKELTDETPIVVTFPDHPVIMLAPERAPKLLTTADAKRRLLEAENVEVVMLPFDKALAGTSSRDFMRRLREDYGVDKLMLGFNNRFGSDRCLTHSDYKRIGNEEGIKVVTAQSFKLSLNEGETASLTVSSTAIRELLERGDVVMAEKMLGRPFSIEGKVIWGQQIGRTINFPTANLAVDSRMCIPATGVYYALANIKDEGVEIPSVVNIGYRPTVDKSHHPYLTIEAHLLDFQGDLYDKTLELKFMERLRGERRFESIEALRAQIAEDVIQARQLSQL